MERDGKQLRWHAFDVFRLLTPFRGIRMQIINRDTMSYLTSFFCIFAFNSGKPSEEELRMKAGMLLVRFSRFPPHIVSVETPAREIIT